MDIWLKPDFTPESAPDWTCPFCRIGFLRVEKDQLQIRQIQPRHIFPTDDKETVTAQYSFSGVLKCSNCSKSIVFIGYGRDHRTGYYPSHSDYFHEEDTIWLTPTSFVPTIPFFLIPSHYPMEVQKTLVKAFELYWIDLFSCAEKIKACLDLIGLRFPKNLDFLEVKKIVTQTKEINRFKIGDAFAALQKLLRTAYAE